MQTNYFNEIAALDGLERAFLTNPQVFIYGRTAAQSQGLVSGPSHLFYYVFFQSILRSDDAQGKYKHNLYQCESRERKWINRVRVLFVIVELELEVRFYCLKAQ